METRQERGKTVVSLLKTFYPHAAIVLRYRNPWELLVAVVLSAQCTDAVVNRVTDTLFTTYPTLEDYVRADPKKFERDIKSTGFFRNKAKHILAAASIVKHRFGGKVPNTMKDLLTIPGVARKTANVILGNAYNVVEGIAVDTHVLRLSQRLRLVDIDSVGGKKEVVFTRDPFVSIQGNLSQKIMNTVIDFKKDADPVKIEQQLIQNIPKEDWFTVTYLLIDHGRAVCRAQNPQCSVCVLNKICAASRV